MLRAAEKLASEVDGTAVVTGHSLGQVASQTLHNLLAVQRGIRLPVLRPLIGLDKNEIEAMAREIGTYALSIHPSPSCPFVPTRPATLETAAEAAPIGCRNASPSESISATSVTSHEVDQERRHRVQQTPDHGDRAERVRDRWQRCL